MIKIKKLYSFPEIFDPICFKAGFNIITGDKSEGNNKTNGVGKSVAIDFLNFCLLKKYEDCRISKIPDSVINKSVSIILDLKINDKNITISRKLSEPNFIKIFNEGNEISLKNTDEAYEYLENIYFETYSPSIRRISFRSLLAPIIRDERSEFKDIIRCFDTDKAIPPDYKPHLFFLNLDVDLYEDIENNNKEYKENSTYLNEIKKKLTQNNKFKINEAKAKFNELEREVFIINNSINQLKNNDSFNILQKSIIEIEVKLNELRIKQKAINYEINQINSLPDPEIISDIEITILFNQFKNGLGDLIKKNIDDFKQLRNKIDKFRNSLVNERLVKLKDELRIINEKIIELDNEYSQKISLFDKGELLKDLKTSINIFNNVNQEYSELKILIKQYDETEKCKKNLDLTISNKIVEFDDIIKNKENLIKSFEKTILDIHESIIGNKKAHFEIKTNKKKEFLFFDLRTDDDGSWSTERLKVFMYDIALLFNEYTKKNHPNFLIHDNIFNIDNDSLEKSLKYVLKQHQNIQNDFQYILTINTDMIENLQNFEEIKSHIIATFTKNKRFLKQKYDEIRKK